MDHCTCPYCHSPVAPVILTSSNPADCTPTPLVLSDGRDELSRSSLLHLLSCWLPCFDDVENQAVISLSFPLYAVYLHLLESSQLTEEGLSLFRSVVLNAWRWRGASGTERIRIDDAPLIESFMLLLFCVSERDGCILPLEDGVRVVLKEIIHYVRDGELENAVKLYLFCRGGEVHPGFNKQGVFC